jgi:hypothetical protein
MRRVGVLMPFDENDPVAKAYVSAFTQALADLGWTDGRNVRMDLRWGGGDINRIRALAQELVGLQPDIILAGGSPAIVALQRETPTIPIVFVAGDDAVASGFVPRLDRPSGNVTGFATFEASMGGKWLELLSEIAMQILVPRAGEDGALDDRENLRHVTEIARRPDHGDFHAHDFGRRRDNPGPIARLRILEFLRRVGFQLCQLVRPVVVIVRPSIAELLGTILGRHMLQGLQRLDQALADVRPIPGRRNVFRRGRVI